MARGGGNPDALSAGDDPEAAVEVANCVASEAETPSPYMSSRPSKQRLTDMLSPLWSRRASWRPRSSFIEPQPEEMYAEEPARQTVAKLLDSKVVDVFVAVSTAVTFAIIIVDTNARASHKPAPRGLEFVQFMLYLLQIAEFSGRAFVDRSRVMHTSWNIIDLLVIVGASLDYVVILAGTHSEFGMMRMLRLVRVVRLLKAICRLTFLRELRKLLMMVGGCMKALFWSTLLLALAMTIWSIVVVETLNPLVHEMASAGAWKGCDRCSRAFSSVFQANLTLFSTIVAGDSWGYMAVPIIEAHPWTAAIFAGALLTLVFGILNLIVAVVVDTFAEARSKDVGARAQDLAWEERQEKKALRSIFAKIDSGQSGSIELDEIVHVARKSPEFTNWLRVLGVDAKDLKEMFQMMDLNANNSIELEEFVETMYRLKNEESKTTTHFMKQKLAHLGARQREMEAKFDDMRSTVSSIPNLNSRLTQVSSRLDENENQIKHQLIDHQATIKKSLETYNKSLETCMHDTVDKVATAWQKSETRDGLPALSAVPQLLGKPSDFNGHSESSNRTPHEEQTTQPPTAVAAPATCRADSLRANAARRDQPSSRFVAPKVEPDGAGPPGGRRRSLPDIHVDAAIVDKLSSATGRSAPVLTLDAASILERRLRLRSDPPRATAGLVAASGGPVSGSSREALAMRLRRTIRLRGAGNSHNGSKGATVGGAGCEKNLASVRERPDMAAAETVQECDPLVAPVERFQGALLEGLRAASDGVRPREELIGTPEAEGMWMSCAN